MAVRVLTYEYEDEDEGDEQVVGYNDRGNYSSGLDVVKGKEKIARMTKSPREMMIEDMSAFLSRRNLSSNEINSAIATASKVRGIDRYNAKTLAVAAVIYNSHPMTLLTPIILSRELKRMGLTSSPSPPKDERDIDLSAVVSYMNKISLLTNKKQRD